MDSCIWTTVNVKTESLKNKTKHTENIEVLEYNDYIMSLNIFFDLN